MDEEMRKALEADGEKLRALTGEDHGPYFFDEADDYDPEEEAMAEAEMNCGMLPDGQCMNAGSEYCDWECPFRC